MSTDEHLFSPHAEQAVLGALLAFPGAWQRIEGTVTASDFYGPAHREVFAAIAALVAEGQPVDPITVDECMQRAGTAEGIGVDVLRALRESVVGVESANAHAAVVRDRARQRQLRAIGNELQAAALEPGGRDVYQVIAGASELLRQLGGTREAMRPAFEVVPMGDVLDEEPDAPSLWWGPWVPAGVVTHYSAHGGTGKSTIALMLAASIAAGRPLFGVPTRLGRVAFYSAEDPAAVVRRRLAKILRGLGIDPADLGDRLHILDATVGDAALFHEVTTAGVKSGATTRAYDGLRRYVDENEIDVVMVDNASDVFDASEIDRARVRAFMRALASIAKERDGAVILLGHVDKGTSRGDRGANSEGYSGSTAWHNSARSRIFMSRDKEGILTLEHQKANLTRLADPLRLMWPDGAIPQLEYVPNGFVQGIRERADVRPILKLIAEFNERGEFISTAEVGPGTAHAKLADQPGFPRHLRKPKETAGVIREAHRQGLIEREEYRNPARHPRERWSLTDAGRNLIGRSAPVAPVAPVHTTDATSAAGRLAAPVAPVQALGGVGGVSRALGGQP